jgi:hypothetical protein
VRCGHCQEVFDASSSLFDLADGADFTTATPVASDDVARLAAGLQREAEGGAPAAAALEEPVAASVSGEPAPAPAVPVSHESAPTSAAPVFGEPLPRPAFTEPSSASASSASAATHIPTPDFRAESWNPWAPAPDAVVDRRIRHNATTIPYKPVTIPRSAQPKLKLELTEGQNLHLENATARPPEPSFNLPPESAAQPEVSEQADVAAWPDVVTRPDDAVRSDIAERPDVAAQPDIVEQPYVATTPDVPNRPNPTERPKVTEPPPHTWRHADARPEPALDPDDGTMVPPSVPDGEPHFGPAAAAPFATAEPPHDETPFTVMRETRAPEPRRMGWRVLGVLVALVLLVTLLAQLAWWQRETIMVYAPRTQMLFAQACAQLGCTFSPPRDIDGLQVEPSDLRQVDGPHKLELKMPLRNRFNVALAYPAVELTLLDEHNNVALRRVLEPQDYVRPGTPIAAGLPPHTTETMIVRLDTGNAVATNFRLQIFYP